MRADLGVAPLRGRWLLTLSAPGKAFEDGSACGEPGLARSPSAMLRPDSGPCLHLVRVGVWASALEEMVDMGEEAARAGGDADG